MALKREEKLKLVELFRSDPCLFALNVVPHYFTGSLRDGFDEYASLDRVYVPEVMAKCEMPWVHRGALAILTRNASWLKNYGELDKIYRHFYATIGEDKVYGFEPVLNEAGNIIDLVFALNWDQMQLMLPRGSAKTTLIKIAMTYLVAYKIVDYFLYVSSAQPHAEAQIADVKMIVSDKHRFVELYGNQKPAQRTGKKWGADECETESGVLFGARGMDGQIRGMQIKGLRPKLIILDDIEDEDNIATEAQRTKLNRKYHSVIEPALRAIYDKSDPYPPTIIALNTLLSTASLNGDFLRSEYWFTIRFGSKDLDGKFWFPLKLDEKEYARKRRMFIEAGQLDTFELEYDNKDRKTSDKFVPESFINIRPVPETPVWHVLAGDPAISEKRKADEATLTVCAMEEFSGDTHVRWQEGKRGWHVNDYVDTIFRQVERYDINLVGIESNAYQAVLLQLLQTEMVKRGRYFHLVGLTHWTNKLQRIKGWLRAPYLNGTLTHEHSFPDLIAEIVDLYDDHVPDNRVDGLAMCMEAFTEYRDLLGDPLIEGEAIANAQAKIIRVI